MTLKARVLTGLALVLLLTVAAAGVVVVSQRNHLLDQLDDQLEHAVGTLPPPGALAPPVNSELDEPISDIFVAEIRGSGETDVLAAGVLLDDSPDISQVAISATGRRTSTVDGLNGLTTFRVLSVPRPGIGATMVIAFPTTDVDQTVRQLIVTFMVIIALVAAVLSLIGWWVIRLGLRPLSQMTATAEAIARGDRSKRAPVSGSATEADQLASAFNEMLDQRDEAENRLRRFVSDASHELRTPLTSIRGYLDLHAQGGLREPGQFDDAVRRMKAESARMASLVEDLLLLARLDEKQPLNPAAVDLGQLVADIVKDGATRHPGRSIRCVAPDPGTTVIEADPARIQQLLTCLLDNALTHAPEADILIEAESDAGGTRIAVTDDGPGLSAEEANRAFDRFYRGDPSRVRSTGGSGLGLAIARSLAEAHGGDLTLTTEPGQGCVFTIRLPQRG